MKLNLVKSTIKGLSIDLENKRFCLWLNHCPEGQPTSYEFPVIDKFNVTGQYPKHGEVINSHILERSGDNWKHTISTDSWVISFESPTVKRVSLSW